MNTIYSLLILIASLVLEVGFDPDTGEWYYKMMRMDKKSSNHISTVMGTLLELAEHISQVRPSIGAF